MTCGVATVHGFLNLAVLHSIVEAAVFLDAEEQLPCLTGNGSGEVLYVPRAAGNVDDLIEVRLLLQQQLLVACQTLREVGRYLVWGIERNHRH